MFRKFASRTYCVRLVIWCLSLSISALIATALVGCKHSKKDEPTDPSDHSVSANEMVVYETDSTEWHVRFVATGKLYADAVQVAMPAPYRLPTKEDAQILKTLTYPSSERFVTSDGYTFGMPSPSLTKAGAKTKYSVLCLWIRVTTIDVPF
jgi:hypothetical protein